MSIAARPRCHLCHLHSRTYPGFRGFIPTVHPTVHHIHHVLPNKICEIWKFSTQNSVRQLLRPPPLLWGCSEPAWMFAQVPQFLSSFANSPIPSTSQAQVPQRSFVCQFSTWRVPVSSDLAVITINDHRYTTGICKLWLLRLTLPPSRGIALPQVVGQVQVWRQVWKLSNVIRCDTMWYESVNCGWIVSWFVSGYCTSLFCHPWRAGGPSRTMMFFKARFFFFPGLCCFLRGPKIEHSPGGWRGDGSHRSSRWNKCSWCAGGRSYRYLAWMSRDQKPSTSAGEKKHLKTSDSGDADFITSIGPHGLCSWKHSEDWEISCAKMERIHPPPKFQLAEIQLTNLNKMRVQNSIR